MNKGDIINGYRILEDFKVAGGMSKISFAERDGKEYFIKEFLYPKYPSPDSPGSERIKDQKRKACEAFEKHHNRVNELIRSKTAGLGGNLIYSLDFFREGTTYYKVNEKIDTKSLSLKEISELSSEKIIIIATSVCQSIGILHDLNIVHGDLKPENILIKETSRGIYSGKLIDFDDSYFSKEPPSDRERIVGTPEYYSPELAEYIMDEDNEIPGESLMLSSDIFTLGIILSEYFTGKKPLSIESESVWKNVKDGNTIHFSKSLPSEIEELIQSMLSLNPISRPTIKQVHHTLRCIREGRDTKKVYPIDPSLREIKHVRLRGSIFSRHESYDKSTSEKKPLVTSEKKRVGLRGKGLNIKG